MVVQVRWFLSIILFCGSRVPSSIPLLTPISWCSSQSIYQTLRVTRPYLDLCQYGHSDAESISASTAYCNNATIQQIIIIIRGHQSRGLNWGWLRISFHSTVVLDYLKIIEYFQQPYSASISEAKFVPHPTNPHLVDSLWDPFGSWPFSERWSKQKFCRGLVM